VRHRIQRADLQQNARHRRDRIAAERSALNALAVHEQPIRLNGPPHRRIRGAHDSARISMARPPRSKRTSHLPRHRPAHRRIDFQEHAIGAGVHQREQCIRRTFFGGVVGKSTRISCDCDYISSVRL
jgi:hypothetical protein